MNVSLMFIFSGNFQFETGLLGSFTLQSCNNGWKMCKKVWWTCKVIVFLCLLLFYRSHCCHRHHFLSSLLLWSRNFATMVTRHHTFLYNIAIFIFFTHHHSSLCLSPLTYTNKNIVPSLEKLVNSDCTWMTALNQQVLPTFLRPTGHPSCLCRSYGFTGSTNLTQGSPLFRFSPDLFSAKLASKTLTKITHSFTMITKVINLNKLTSDCIWFHRK